MENKVKFSNIQSNYETVEYHENKLYAEEIKNQMKIFASFSDGKKKAAYRCNLNMRFNAYEENEKLKFVIIKLKEKLNSLQDTDCTAEDEEKIKKECLTTYKTNRPKELLKEYNKINKSVSLTREELLRCILE